MSVGVRPVPRPVQSDEERAQAILARRRQQSRRAAAAVAVGQVGVLVALLGAWQGAAEVGVIDPFFWSTPVEVAGRFVEAFSEGRIFTDTWWTFQEAAYGFVLGTALGTAAGLALWSSTYVERVADPYLVAFNAMPKVALAPLITVTFGIGMIAKIALAVMLVAVVAAIAARDGASRVDPDLVGMLRSLGAKRWQIFTKAVVPTALPSVFSAFRVNIGLALIGAVVGEFIGGRNGLGILAVRAAATYDVALIWVSVVTLMVLALVMYRVVGLLEHLLKRTTHVADEDVR